MSDQQQQQQQQKPGKKLHMPFRSADDADDDSDWSDPASPAKSMSPIQASTRQSSPSARSLSPSKATPAPASPSRSSQASSPRRNTTTEVLFGGDDSDSEDDDEAKKTSTDLFGGDDSSEPGASGAEDGYLKVPKEARPKRHIEKHLTLKPHVPLAQNANDVYLVKLPNFLHVDPEPFDEETYQMEEYKDLNGDEELNDDESNENQRVKLKVENTIRWRNVLDDNGQEKMETNTHFVKWSDGSLSLVVGAEYFDVSYQQLQDQHQYLFMVNPGGVMEAQCKFNQAMQFRPHSTSSFTHKKLTATVLNKHKKVNKTKMVLTVENPEKAKKQAEKDEAEAIRARKKQEALQRQREARTSDRLTVDALELEEFETSRRPSRGRWSARRTQLEDEDEGYEDVNAYEKDDFVVDDDFVEMADDESDLGLSDEDEKTMQAKEQRILAAKRSMNGEGKSADKRRRVVMSDDDEDLDMEDGEVNE